MNEREERRLCWLGLAWVEGLGPINLEKALQLFGGNPVKVWYGSRQYLSKIWGAKLAAKMVNLRKNLDLIQEADRLKSQNIKFVTREEKEYPSRLKDIHDPPPVIFYRGVLPDFLPSLALVGSRKTTRYGEKAARDLSGQLASRGVVIVSGLALGIDACAHRAAITAGGKTIAVLGSGHDYKYPAQNRNLYQDIPEHGAIVSEFPPHVPPLRGNFPRRNRLISGLSQAVLVVEAAANSGSLITANLALQQNREVMAVPGDIYSPNSTGVNRLIQTGAYPVLSAQDVLTYIFGKEAETTAPNQFGVQIPAGISELEKKLIKIFSQEIRLNLNQLSNLANTDISQLNAALVKLEIKGIIAREPGQKYYFKGLQNLLNPI